MKINSRNLSVYILLAVLALATAGCSSQRRTTKRSETIAERTRHDKETALKAEKGLKDHEKMVIEEAFTWMGTPYEFGRQDKGVATDCSGMVKLVFECIGCELPRNSAKQAEFCEEISRHHIKPGDLVFFITNSGNRINHVGIMIDELQFIHASSKGVIISSMETSYYQKHFQKYCRVPGMKH